MASEGRLPPGLVPLFLNLAQAAAYAGVSRDVFRSECEAGLWPRPLRRGADAPTETWHRESLDAAARDLSERAGAAWPRPHTPPPPPAAAPRAKLAQHERVFPDAASERAPRRGPRRRRHAGTSPQQPAVPEVPDAAPSSAAGAQGEGAPPALAADEILLRIAEVARLAALSRSTLYKRCAEGTFPHPLQLGGGAVRWRRSDVLAWQQGLSANTSGPLQGAAHPERGTP